MENPLSFLLCPAPTHGSEPGGILQIPRETDAGKFKPVSQLPAGFAAGTHQNGSAYAWLCRCLQQEKGGIYCWIPAFLAMGHPETQRKIHGKLSPSSPYLQVSD